MNTVMVPEAEEFGPRCWMLISREVIDGVRTSVRALPVLGRGVFIRTYHQVPMNVAEPKDDEEPQIEWGPPVMDEPVLLADTLMIELTKRDFSEIVDDKDQPQEVRVEVISREVVGLNIARDRYQPKKGPAQIPQNMTLRPGMIIPMEQRLQPMVAPGAGGPPPEVMAKLRAAAEKAAAEKAS